MFITPTDKDRILTSTSNKLVEVISSYQQISQSGTSRDYKGVCPTCQSKKFTVNPTKGLFKCFNNCGLVGKTPVDYLMKAQNKSFVEALKLLADQFNIIIDLEPPTASKQLQKVRDKQPVLKDGVQEQSFCAKMLQESGLTFEDVAIRVFKQDENKTTLLGYSFFPGTADKKGDIDRNGDDVVIAYYDLEGNPVTYEVLDHKTRRPTGKFKEYHRIRWQYPDEHLDKDGKSFKYKSPFGAPTCVYFPNAVREMYKRSEPIDRLFVQEGEKKAEKATKHGLPSIGISGIGNMGTNRRLPEDVIKLIQRCEVKEIVFMLDSDFKDLSSNIKINDNVQKRPRNFFYAVRSFKEYFKSLRNREIYLEIFFGHIKKNEAGDKGVDDLLANTLSGSEQDLLSDINKAINEKDKFGKYVDLYKITSLTDHKLEEIWDLHSVQDFAKTHFDVLKFLPEFKIGQHKWRINDAGELESAQPLESEEQYWDKNIKSDRSGNEVVTYDFRYKRCFEFLRNRGFGRYRQLDGSFSFVRLEHPFVTSVEPWQIRDFVQEFTKQAAPEDVLEMIYRGGPQYLGPDKLQNIDFIHPAFSLPESNRQMFYFSNKCWEVTATSRTEMDYSSVNHHLWRNEQKDYAVSIIDEQLVKVTKCDDGKFVVKISKEGENCHFLSFLRNASDFTWRKHAAIADGIQVDLDPDEEYENTLHLVSKLTAIGFMLLDYKDMGIARAVISMDGKQSEVGASNGRSGKSMIGELLKRVRQTAYINGKNSEMTRDQFLWDEITEKTKTVFIDDIRANFDFEFLFANITGDWAVNYKGGRRCTFPFRQSPKLYITTNHAINGSESSYTDRQWLIAFSDFYNDQHKPKDDFGVLFFEEWDYEQWNLCWNLMAVCVQLYLQIGCVQAPQDQIKLRKQRQEMGEEFLMWAEEYFSSDARMNSRIPRKEMYDNFLEYAPDQRKYVRPPLFRKKIERYADYKGYIFNPQRYDRMGNPLFYNRDGAPVVEDKSGGVEYFTLGARDYWRGAVVQDQPEVSEGSDQGLFNGLPMTE